MQKHKYVACYYAVRYKFGDDLEKLRSYVVKHGVLGTEDFYSIQENGLWNKINAGEQNTQGEKNETV